jgi:hypothetical protein
VWIVKNVEQKQKKFVANRKITRVRLFFFFFFFFFFVVEAAGPTHEIHRAAMTG